MVKVHIEVKKELRIGDKGERFKTELLDEVSEEGLLHMESVTPRGYTHRLANSYRISEKTENSRLITNDRKYGVYVNEGTGIYGRGSPIVPIHASCLHFWVGGAPLAGTDVFTLSVRGQKCQHFVEKGAKDIANSVEKIAPIVARRVLG
jgi:hypothetical protein